MSAVRTATAVVVNWRQAELSSAALASLERQTGLAERGVELGVVLVDNDSGDGSAALLRERHPGVLVVETGRNGGFGAGVNAGIRARPADVYLLLNNDAVAEPGFAAALLATLEAEPDAGAVTARMLLAGRYRRLEPGAAAEVGAKSVTGHDGAAWVAVAGASGAVDAQGDAGAAGGATDGVELVNSTGNEVTRSGNGRDRDWLVPADGDAGGSAARPAGEVFGFCGGAAALRAEALDAVGLFDESLFMYYEDTELSWRLRRAGWRVRYAPDAVVRHAHAASSGTGSALFRSTNERNRLLVALRAAPAGVAARALARTIAGTARAVLGALRRPDAAHRAEARRRLGSLGAALRSAPANLRLRRRLDREALVPRRAVAALLVDG